MVKCKKCGLEFVPQKGLKSYCSLSCRNSRKMTEEIKKKISEGVMKHIDKNGKNIFLYTQETYNKISKTRKNNEKIKLLNENFDDLSWERLRKRILIEQDYKCNKCGLSEWFGKTLSLEIDHIDGDHNNGNRNNLEALCPNCHSITPTWRGRNIKNQKLKVTEEDLFKALLKYDWNMRQALLDVGLVAKGGNYKRCHKLKREYEALLL
jgi:5-methylcytosine-specific restriction endonuclease McrA